MPPPSALAKSALQGLGLHTTVVGNEHVRQTPRTKERDLGELARKHVVTEHADRLSTMSRLGLKYVKQYRVAMADAQASCVAVLLVHMG